MKPGYFSEFSPVIKLLFALFVILIVFIVLSLITILPAIPIFNVDLLDFANSTNFSNPKNIPFLKYLQAVQTIGLFIVPPFVVAYLMDKNGFNFLQIKKIPAIQTTILALSIVIISLPLVNFLMHLNSYLHLPHTLQFIEDWMKSTEKDAQLITNAFLKVNSLWGLLLNLFIIAVLPALGEELLFRGVLQNIFISLSKNKHIGIWLAAILFSAFHLQFYGFIPRAFLGAMFGYILYWSKSIWLPIVVHFFNNAFAVISFYLTEKKIIGTETDTIGTTSGTFFITGISITFSILILYLIWKKEKEYAQKSKEIFI